MPLFFFRIELGYTFPGIFWPLQMRRLTRLTNAFSKKLDNLKAAVALHFAYYNFCRVHKTLRVTPAMEAGMTHVWTIGELIGQGV